jgi:hypothetical protein
MQIWVALGKWRERNHIADTEACRHAHPDNAAKLTTFADAVLRLVQSGKNGFNPRQKFPPASVGTTARVVRDSSLTPSSASRSAMAREACDCDSPHSRAAAEKLPSRATRM